MSSVEQTRTPVEAWLASEDHESTLSVADSPQAVPSRTRVADRYEIIDEIARGGMGIVYRANDRQLGREVALKVLPTTPAGLRVISRRFLTESRITAQLQHPAIPPVHELGELTDGRPFLAMKFIKGQTLEVLLKDRPSPQQDRDRFLACFEQICQALAYAHAHSVIHRDLKPTNIMIGAFGEVQVMDWGLAKVLGEADETIADPEATASNTIIRSVEDVEHAGQLTQAGTVLGTPAYMPPEQALGALGQVDTRSDVFGLGAMLAMILTGKPPFLGKTAETTRMMAAQGKVQECFDRLDQCDAEPELVALCKNCLQTNPSDRPADARELAAAISKFRSDANNRAHLAQVTLAETNVRQAEQSQRRRLLWWSVGMALAILTVGLIGTAVGFVNANAAQRQEAKARLDAEAATKQVEVSLAAETQARAHADESAKLAQDSLILLGSKLPELYRKSLYARGAQKELTTLLEQALEKQAAANVTKSARARALYEVSLRRGDLAMWGVQYPQAQKYYSEALAVIKDIEVTDADSAFREAEVKRKLGTLDSLQPPSGFTKEHYTELFDGALASIRSIVEKHAHLDGIQRRVQWEEARVHAARAAALRTKQLIVNARLVNSEAIWLMEQLLAVTPEDARLASELADIYSEQGDIGRLLEDPLLEESAIRRSYGLLRPLLDKEPYDLDILSRQANVLFQLGRFYFKSARLESARKYYNTGIMMSERMIRTPEIIQVKVDMTYALFQMYSLLREMKDPKAEQFIDLAIEYRREHVKAQPFNEQAKVALARALTMKEFSPEAIKIMIDQLNRRRLDVLTYTDSAHVLGSNAAKLRNGRSLNELSQCEFLHYVMLRAVAMNSLKQLLKLFTYRDVVTFKSLAEPLKDTTVYADTLKKVEANAAKLTQEAPK